VKGKFSLQALQSYSGGEKKYSLKEETQLERGKVGICLTRGEEKNSEEDVSVRGGKLLKVERGGRLCCQPDLLPFREKKKFT